MVLLSFDLWALPSRIACHHLYQLSHLHLQHTRSIRQIVCGKEENHITNHVQKRNFKAAIPTISNLSFKSNTDTVAEEKMQKIEEKLGL